MLSVAWLIMSPGKRRDKNLFYGKWVIIKKRLRIQILMGDVLRSFSLSFVLNIKSDLEEIFWQMGKCGWVENPPTCAKTFLLCCAQVWNSQRVITKRSWCPTTMKEWAEKKKLKSFRVSHKTCSGWKWNVLYRGPRKSAVMNTPGTQRICLNTILYKAQKQLEVSWLNKNMGDKTERQRLKTTAAQGISLLCMLMTPNKESGGTCSPEERDGIKMFCSQF